MKTLKEKILNFHSESIKSIIVDIRGNRGGNDQVWRELLGMIYEIPVEIPCCYIANTDKDVIKRIPPVEKTNPKRIYEYIDVNHSFQVFVEGTDSIICQQSNLSYNGIIYLLVDEDIYSSAGAFASLCTKTDRIKTVGMPTGKMLGQGVTPSVFILPNSRLIFTMELVLDAACVSKAKDFYHDHINYPITPSIDYYKYWYDPTRPYTIDEKAMYEHDEVFLKALSVIKNIE
jgi:C-terminal processing protease CtpA/Prc